jgi:regulator of protease activity HflC (stomatin/prohibitin superfamily)
MKTNKQIWIQFYIILFLISSGIFLVIIPLHWPVWAGVIIMLLLFGSILAITLFKAWTVVPHQYRYIIEIFGKYIGSPLEPGAYWLFPWFGYVEIRSSVFLGQQLMPLYLDEKISEGYGGGSVEFNDCSAPVKATLYFSIFDPEKSTYETNDLFQALEEKADGVIRTFLGMYSLQSAISMKGDFNIATIATLSNIADKDFSEEVVQDKLQKSEFYKSLESWGVHPVDVVISDFELPSKLQEIRETILVAGAEKGAAGPKLETAKIEKEIKIVKAQGEAAAKILEGQAAKKIKQLDGEGEADRFKSLITSGAPKEQIPNFIVQNNKWDAIKNSTNKIIITDGGSNGSASCGAQLAAGFSAFQGNTTKTEVSDQEQGAEKKEINPKKEKGNKK